MITGSVIVGRAEVGAIVCTPAGMAKLIVWPASRSAFRIAWRSEPIPLSLVLVTTNALATITPVANSEVLSAGEVAVAVTT